MSGSNINDLRDHLMGTLAALRDRNNPMEPDRARAIAQVAGVLVDTAKAEIDYLRATGQGHSDFLQTAEPENERLQRLPGGVTRHRLLG